MRLPPCSIFKVQGSRDLKVTGYVGEARRPTILSQLHFHSSPPGVVAHFRAYGSHWPTQGSPPNLPITVVLHCAFSNISPLQPATLHLTHFYHKDGDSVFLGNFDNYLSDYTVAQSTTSQYENLPRVNIEVMNEPSVNPENIETNKVI